jgi:hypothetical protein
MTEEKRTSRGYRVGYVGVSSLGQNTDRQLDCINLDRTFPDHCSGKDTNRPQLKAPLANLREGDEQSSHAKLIVNFVPKPFSMELTSSRSLSRCKLQNRRQKYLACFQSCRHCSTLFKWTSNSLATCCSVNPWLNRTIARAHPGTWMAVENSHVSQRTNLHRAQRQTFHAVNLQITSFRL